MHKISDRASQRSGVVGRALLLRCWRQLRAGREGEAAWRFSVTEAEGNRRRWGCASLEGLVALVRERLERGERLGPTGCSGRNVDDK